MEISASMWHMASQWSGRLWHGTNEVGAELLRKGTREGPLYATSDQAKAQEYGSIVLPVQVTFSNPLVLQHDSAKGFSWRDRIENEAGVANWVQASYAHDGIVYSWPHETWAIAFKPETFRVVP